MSQKIKVGDHVKIVGSLYFGTVVEELAGDRLKVKPKQNKLGHSQTGNFHWNLPRDRVIKLNSFWNNWMEWYENQTPKEDPQSEDEQWEDCSSLKKNEHQWEKWNPTLVWKTFQQLSQSGSLKEIDCIKCYRIYQNLILNLKNGIPVPDQDSDLGQAETRLDYILAIGISLNDSFLEQVEQI